MKTKAALHTVAELPDAVLSQPSDIRGLPIEQRNRLVISLKKVDDIWRIVSRYGDDVWWLMGAPTNIAAARNKLNFARIPEPLRESAKAVIYRYMRKGCNGGRRPGATTITSAFAEISYFLRYVRELGVAAFSDITPIFCANYAQVARAKPMQDGKAPSVGTIYRRLKAVEDLYQLSLYTETPLPLPPWPDTSSHRLSGVKKAKAEKKTPLIPDEVLVLIFQAAWEIVQKAPQLLDWRDEMQEFIDSGKSTKYLRQGLINGLGFNGNYKDFKRSVIEIRTACYIVIATLSGCRIHELGYVRKGAFYSTEDDEGEQYWWMRSVSRKTHVGETEWMIPEAAVDALKVMERWAAPYHAQLHHEVATYRAQDSTDIRIALAEEHLDALFVGMDIKHGNLVRTLSTQPLNDHLKRFAKDRGLTWDLASHQFRRKFANYAARSQFGDLRYLKEHFKHWSMDMTLGYALNESQELELYLEILDESDEVKVGVVASWLNESEPLAGGYGRSLVDWRTKGEKITLFKTHDQMVRSVSQSTHIRSNGHAWCTADDNLCVGNNLEKTRCGAGCNNAVIGRQHGKIYQGLYDQLNQLADSRDIGPGGRERVRTDLARCTRVLDELGYNVSEKRAA